MTALDVAADYVSKLNDLFAQRGCGFFAYNFGGIIRIEMTAPHAVPDRQSRKRFRRSCPAGESWRNIR